MENHSYSEVIGAPYIASLAAKGTVGGSYFAIEHPSLPNYLDLVGGSNGGITNDCTPPTSCPVNAANLADGIDGSGRTWKSYAESAPSACPLADSGEFVTKHVPLLYYTDIQTNSARCNRIVPYTQLASDLGSVSTTPNYAFITPNLINDMHDGSVSQGDTWLSNNVPAILTSPAFTQQHSLLIVLWDEDDNSQSNQVALIAVGYHAKIGYVSQVRYNHYSLLKTVEAAWGLATLTGNDQGASPMTDLISG